MFAGYRGFFRAGVAALWRIHFGRAGNNFYYGQPGLAEIFYQGGFNRAENNLEKGGFLFRLDDFRARFQPVALIIDKRHFFCFNL